MTTNSGQLLSAMLRQLTGVQTAQKTINQNFRTMAVLAGGAMAAIGGVSALKGLWNLVEASKALNGEINKLRSMGGDFEKNIPAIRRDALNLSQQVGGPFSMSATVRAYRETLAQLNSKDEADLVLPYITKGAIVASQVTGEKPEAMIQNMMRTMDSRGALTSERADGTKFIDAKKVIPELNAMVASFRMYAGQTNSAGMLAFAQMASLPAKVMTPQAFYADAMETAAAGSPSRTGTAMMSFAMQMAAGVMPLRVAKELLRMGILKPGELSQGRGGQVLLAPSATKRGLEIIKDPFTYITGPLNEMMNKKGMSDSDKIIAISKMFGRQTVVRLVAEANSSEAQYTRSRSIFKNVTSIEEAFKMLQEKDLSYNIQTFTSSWQSFIEVLGDAGVPRAISLLQSMTSGLNALTRLVEAHPDAAAWMLGLAGGLAAMAALGGSITVLTMGLNGLVVPLTAMANIAGLAALGSGLTTVGAGLAALIAPVAAFLAIKGASDRETPETRSAIESYRRDLLPKPQGLPHDGYDVMGRPIPPPGPPTGPGGVLGKISYSPGGGDTPRIAGDVYLDGQKVGQWMAKWMAGQTSRPAAGPSAVDTRMTFVPPGGAFA